MQNGGLQSFVRCDHGGVCRTVSFYRRLFCRYQVLCIVLGSWLSFHSCSGSFLFLFNVMLLLFRIKWCFLLWWNIIWYQQCIKKESKFVRTKNGFSNWFIKTQCVLKTQRMGDAKKSLRILLRIFWRRRTVMILKGEMIYGKKEICGLTRKK